MMWAEASLVSPHERSLVSCLRAAIPAPGRLSIAFIWFRRSSDRGRLLLVERGQDLGRVALRLDLRPDAGDPAGGVDEEGRPGRTPVFLAVVLLLDPGAVGLRDVVVDVGEQ